MLREIDLNMKPSQMSIQLAKPNRTIVGKIKHYNKTPILKLSLGRLNEISFTIPYKIEKKHELVDNKIVSLIRNRFLLKVKWNHVSDWFIINDLSDSVDDSSEGLVVHAFSLGNELKDKLIESLKEDSLTPQQIMDKALSSTNWSTGTIDDKIVSKYRSFDVTETTVLDFLFTIADTFGVLLTFDSENKKVNLVHPDNYKINRGFKITYGHYLKSLTRDSNSDDMTTQLIVSGKDGLSINRINPTGANYIESFSYFMYPFERDANKNVIQSSDFMSDDLCNAILDYEAKVDSYKGQFSSLLDQLNTQQTTKTTKDNELQNLKTDLLTIQNTLDVQRASELLSIYNYTYNGTLTTNSTTLTATNNYAVMIKVSDITNLTVKLDGVVKTIASNTWTVLGKLGNVTSTSVELSGSATNVSISIYVVSIDSTEYSTTGNEADLINKYNDQYKQSQIDSKQVEVNNAQSDIDNTYASIDSIKNDLSIPNNFTPALIQERNEYIITKKWSDENYINDQELYDDAKVKFDDVRKPKINITLNSANFFQMIEEQRNWDKLYLGDVVTVSHPMIKASYEVFVTDMEVSDDALNLTIADFQEIRKDDALLEKINQSYSSSVALEMSKYKWNQVVTDMGTVNDYIQNDHDATKQRITAGVHESVQISGRGIIIRNPDFPNEIIVEQSGVIALSVDNGETWSTAIKPTGIVAERLIGRIIAGVNLYIENESGKFRFDKDGATIDGSSFVVKDANGNNLLNVWNNAVGQGTNYNGVIISQDNGLVVNRNDNKIKAFLNATEGIKIQTFKNNSWVDAFYADLNGILHANGLVINSTDGTSVLIDGNTQTIDFSKFLTIAGKIQATNIELGNIDTSKNAITNGSYFQWDANGFKATDPNDSTRYVLINSSGQTVKKGMIDVERDDGFKTMIGGKINQSFDIQGSDPPHLVDATIQQGSRFFETTMTTGNGAICNLYTFTRVARYAVFQVALMSSSVNQSTAILAESGNESVWLGTASAFDTNEVIQTITLDLGVPDGTVYALKLMLKSYSTTNTAYCRKVRAYQTDFPPA